MNYMGSKNRIAKHLLPIMIEAADNAGITTWVEPFVGGGNMIDKVPDRFKRIGYDFNEHVIYAMCDIRDRAEDLPESITEEYYKEVRGNKPEVFNSWLRFVASFGAKFEGGYARGKNSVGGYRNYVSESKRSALKQSPKISRFNPDSINSIRVCLLKVEGKFVVINASLRMGKDGSLDNETAGGIVCSISEEGKLNSFAVDKFCSKHLFHPNSEVVFDGETLPFYSSLISISQEIGVCIFNTDLVSLDMCLDDKNMWRCIELNLFGQTIRFAQYAGKPFFGKYTDYVINKIIKS